MLICCGCTSAMQKTGAGSRRSSPGPRSGIGGFKEVIVTLKGSGAYSRLKYESGVHRVQRVPVTESRGGFIPQP